MDNTRYPLIYINMGFRDDVCYLDINYCVELIRALVYMGVVDEHSETNKIQHLNYTKRVI